MNTLEHNYNSLMRTLSTVVETIAEKFRIIEGNLMEEYTQQRTRINRRYRQQQELPQSI